MNEQDAPTYAIGAIAQLCNLTQHTIRVWERRYGVVNPLRSPGGTRRYSEQDLRRLRTLNAAVQAGYRIGDIAALDNQAVADLARTNKKGGRIECVEVVSRVNPIDEAVIEDVIIAARALNWKTVERELTVQFRLLGMEQFKRCFVGPLLRRMGQLWEEGLFSMASEHLVSAALRPFLLKAFDLYQPVKDAPTIIFTTPEDEQHDLGLLMAAGTAAKTGAHIVNLGAQLPPDSVAEATTQLHASAVALSVIHLGSGAQRSYLTKLRQQTPAATQIWLGGSKALSGVEGCSVLTLDEMVARIDGLLAAKVILPLRTDG
jgi:DNA-binding transcriptional MerR regulator/methylmalonyl-CoA mutase cobalamin-binding subunit